MGAEIEDQAQEVAVRRLGKDGAELAVFEFQGELRDLMLSSLREGFLTTGSYAPDAKAVSTQSAMSIAVAGSGAGLTALSAHLAPTLFVATADPATLMRLGSGGYGAAVMGAKGITAHAGFIPVSSSLPVVAPLMAMQALNTAVMMQQFKLVDQKLDAIKHTLDRVLAGMEATHSGQLLATSLIVDDIYRQYELDGAFSQDMLVRLALAERDAKGLAARSRQLVEGRNGTDVEDPKDVEQANYDAHSAMLASFVDLRISYLRVCVDMQENPKSVSSSMENLKVAIDDGIEFWEALQSRSKGLKASIDALEASTRGKGWADFLPVIGDGAANEEKLERLKAAWASTMESELKIMSQFHSLVDSARTTRKALDAAVPSSSGTSPTLVYWQDEAGDHAFVTEQNLISA